MSPAHLAVDCEFYKNKRESRMPATMSSGEASPPHADFEAHRFWWDLCCRSRKLMEENDSMRE